MRNKRSALSYFVQAGALRVEDVEPSLWNAEELALYGGDRDKYQAAILDQYKLYVEMADRVSARRALANTFFLALNTAVLTSIGVFWSERANASKWLLVFPVLALLGECMAWFWIVRSYSQLNRAKWVVVGALEKRLPASPCWRAEWQALGKGEDPAKYWPITRVEQLVPILFAVVYLAGFVAVLSS